MGSADKEVGMWVKLFGLFRLQRSILFQSNGIKFRIYCALLKKKSRNQIMGNGTVIVVRMGDGKCI